MLPTCASNMAIDIWKGETLSAIAAQLTRPQEPIAQKGIGIWAHSERIPYPTHEQIRVLPNGCLIFSFYADTYKISLSVWVMFGEIRIGLKLPAACVATPEMQDRYARMYDCDSARPVRKLLSGAILFDWIFSNNDFADFNFMVHALEKPLWSAVIVDRVTQICKHLYMAVTDILISFCGQISVTAPPPGPDGDVQVEIDFLGDWEALNYFIEHQCCGRATSVSNLGGAGYTFAQVPPKGLAMLRAQIGHLVGDADGGEFLINAIRHGHSALAERETYAA